MDERASRIARNEALFREVNEQIESLSRSLVATRDHAMHIVCECGDLDCTEQLNVTVADYERIRSEPALFFIRPGHVRPEVEEVVEENRAFHVVRKYDGEASRVARETYNRED